MALNRRNLLAGTALVVAALAGYGAYVGFTPGTGASSGAQAQDDDDGPPVDPAKLMQPSTLGDKMLGSADAKVTIVEYASATCGHCAKFHRETYPQLKREFIDTGKANFVFREYPLDDLALAAFMLARCAPPDKYFPMIEVLFEQQETWLKGEDKRAELFKIAQLAGFTNDSFEACLKSEPTARGIREVAENASNNFGVDSTPTFFINGKRLKGHRPIEDFRKLIDEALAG
jgi:protein-disulfide isomerase